jgi:hypothetical protein
MSDQDEQWKPIHGWAEPVAQSPAPAAPFGVRLLSSPDSAAPARLEAPPGTLEVGQRFSVRFYHEGAKRVVVEARRVARTQGGDLALVQPLSTAEPAPQRKSERAVISVLVTAEAVDCARLDAGERVEVEVVNVSTGGVLLRSTLPIGYGDVLRIDAPDAAAELRIIRRDPRGPRLAGTFLDGAAGEATYRSLLRLAETAPARTA